MPLHVFLWLLTESNWNLQRIITVTQGNNTPGKITFCGCTIQLYTVSVLSSTESLTD